MWRDDPDWGDYPWWHWLGRFLLTIVLVLAIAFAVALAIPGGEI